MMIRLIMIYVKSIIFVIIILLPGNLYALGSGSEGDPVILGSGITIGEHVFYYSNNILWRKAVVTNSLKCDGSEWNGGISPVWKAGEKPVGTLHIYYSSGNEDMFVYQALNSEKDGYQKAKFMKAVYSDEYNIDGDDDGIIDDYDPYPDSADNGDIIYFEVTDGQSTEYMWSFIKDGEEQVVKSSGFDDAIDYEHSMIEDGWSFTDNTGNKTWEDYLQFNEYEESASGSPIDINDMNYMAYVEQTPEPSYYDSDISSDNTEYKKEYTDIDNNGTVTTAYNQYLGDIAANTELANNNYGEMGKYLKSIDSGVRNMEKLGYGGPSADEIGAAVGEAVSGSGGDSNGSLTAEDIGNEVGESVMGEEEVSENPDDYLPENPGHGHGDASLDDAKGYFETKLDEWFIGFEENEEVNQFFDGTEIVYTGPTSVLSIGPIEIGENTIQEEFDFAAWQSEIQMIGNLLYAFICIYWGLWVFRRD